MLQEIKKEAVKRMVKCLEGLKSELSKVRAGRASVGLLEPVQVPSYGSSMPLNQVATVSVQDARTLLVQPWDRTLTPAVEKAILNAGLGLNPVSAGDVIRIPLPPLTEDRRKEFAKKVKEFGEGTKVSVRNIRRDANQQLKDLLKDKELSEDDVRKGESLIQEATDKHIKEIDVLILNKENDLMEI